MKVSIISDLHIKEPSQDSYQLLLSFLNNAVVKNSTHIVFLGDIFDMMLGGHAEYFDKYSEFFLDIKDKLGHSQQKIIFIEGNHDYHLDNLFIKFRQKYNINKNDLILRHEDFSLTSGTKKIHFAHGDNIFVGSRLDLKYRQVVRSRFIKILAEDFFSFKSLEAIGQWASNLSRKKSTQKYTTNYNETFIRDAYREAAKTLLQQQAADYLICGHSHIKDMFEIENKLYANCGYLPNSQVFLYMQDEKLEFLDL